MKIIGHRNKCLSTFHKLVQKWYISQKKKFIQEFLQKRTVNNQKNGTLLSKVGRKAFRLKFVGITGRNPQTTISQKTGRMVIPLKRTIIILFYSVFC